MAERGRKFAPLSGVIAVLLFVIAAIVAGETPDFDEASEEVVSFYVEEESSQIVASILAAYGALFLIFFVGALRGALRRTEETSGGLSAVAFGGGLIAAVGVLIFAGISFTLADAADSLDPAAAQALNALNGDFFIPLAVGMAALLIASGIGMVRGATLPSWLGWIAIVIGIAAITPAGFIAFLLGLVWIVVTGILLTLRPPTGTSGPSARSPGAAGSPAPSLGPPGPPAP
jgi:hypothetical protein